jgi:adenine-specific DNA-methyltransferase
MTQTRSGTTLTDGELDTRLDGASLDIVAEKRREFLELFPEARSENGQVDFERLRLALGDSVEIGKERFGLTWPGKADCFKTIQVPSMATLLPAPEKSVNFDTTENIIIEGDNLEVLKLLQKSYLGKIKMIYIDPPYNTGNDFIYPDEYSESLTTYLAYTGQIDSDGKRFGTNADTTGRFHSKWLNMMYPRLYLGRNLLCEEGVVFISTGETELANLTLLCDAIFGEENRLGVACRVAKKSNNKGDHWAPNFDYILTYARDKSCCPPFLGGVNVKAYDQVETDGPRKGERYQLVRLYMSTIENQNPEQRFWIDCPDGSRVIPPGSTFPPERPRLGDGIWRWTKTKFEAERDRIVVKEVRSSNLINEKHQPARWNVFTKTYLNDVIKNATSKPNNLIEDHINQIGSHEMTALDIPFDYPKPSTLIKFLCEICHVQGDEIVLDFFAGSGSTADAVLSYNYDDHGKRRFVLIQLPEPTGRSDYATIADLCEQRVRRAIKKLDDADAGKLDMGNKASQDRGFRVFKLAESNVKEWDADIAHDVSTLKEQLRLGVDHLRPGRTDLDIVYEVLLKSGYPLSAKVSTDEIEGKQVYSVADGAFLICLERRLSLELIRAIAARGPERVLCLDEGFAGNDQLKTNAVQTFKGKNITFRTL